MHALWTCTHSGRGTIRMVRPFILYPVGRHIAYTFDCSWFATQAFYMAGLPDPNGFGYRGGVGNTSTLAAHGTRVSDPRPGRPDLLLRSRITSAIACSERNVMGFGSEGGPRIAPQGYRTVTQIRRYV